MGHRRCTHGPAGMVHVWRPVEARLTFLAGTAMSALVLVRSWASLPAASQDLSEACCHCRPSCLVGQRRWTEWARAACRPGNCKAWRGSSGQMQPGLPPSLALASISANNLLSGLSQRPQPSSLCIALFRRPALHSRATTPDGRSSAAMQAGNRTLRKTQRQSNVAAEKLL